MPGNFVTLFGIAGIIAFPILHVQSKKYLNDKSDYLKKYTLHQFIREASEFTNLPEIKVKSISSKQPSNSFTILFDYYNKRKESTIDITAFANRIIHYFKKDHFVPLHGRFYIEPNSQYIHKIIDQIVISEDDLEKNIEDGIMTINTTSNIGQNSK